MSDTTAPRGALSFTPVFDSPNTNPYGLDDVGDRTSPSFVDIDADGDLDAIVGERYGNTLVYLNTGTASSPAFAAASTNPYGLDDVGNAASPSLVDIDSDGDLDALIGNDQGNTWVYLNTGTANSPAFAAASLNPYGLSDVVSYANPSFVDIDDDGDLDGFIGNRDGNTLVYLNTGTTNSPAFAAAATNPYGLGDVGFYASPKLVDIDGDGDLDVVMGNWQGNTLVYQNTGTASSPAFAASSTNPYGLGDVGGYANPSLVDIDSDGDLDALIGNDQGNTLMFINSANPVAPVTTTKANGSYGIGSTITLEVAFSENVLVTGIPRIQLETGLIDRFATYTGGSGTTTLTFTYTVQAGDTSADLDVLSSSALSLNGGTIADAAGNNAILTLAAPGTAGSLGANANLVIDGIAPRGTLAFMPAFAAPVTNPYGLEDRGGYASPNFVDIDDDGDLDAVIGGMDGNTWIYLNTGTARSPAFATALVNPYGLSNAGFYASPELVDIDGDGDLDALIGNSDGNMLVFLNTGMASNPAFAAAMTNPYGLANVGGVANPSLVDIDGDGDLDALVGNDLGNMQVSLNTGTASSPAFAAQVINPFGFVNFGVLAYPIFWDIDGDSDLDALIGNQEGNTQVFLNTGTASSPAFAAAITNPYGLGDVGFNSSPSFVDIDGDGDLDALIGNADGNTLVFLNSANPVAPVTTTASGTYLVGSTITLQVTFSENVIVNTTGGIPTLQLETGVADRFAVFSGGSGTSVLSFTYTVQPGDTSADLDILSSSALALNGSTIADAAGNHAILILANPGAAGSLAANADVVIDAYDVDITGSAGADVIRGGIGDDTLDGAGGNDRLAGREGSDLLTGGEGNDSLFGQGGSDTLLGGNGKDVLDGGTGADNLTGGDGNDTYYVDNINDAVIETNTNPVTGGTDSVYSYLASYTLADNIERGFIKTSAAASLTGNELANALYGGAGNDSLNGAAGNDTLSGGAGADVLTGGEGRDVLTGGLGADTFVFYGGSGRDIIKDFNPSQGDKISIQANINGSGITDAASALAHVSDKWGSALLDLGDGNVVKLTGMLAAELTAADFMVF